MWRVSTILDVNGLSTPHKRLPEDALARGTAVHSATEAYAGGYSFDEFVNETTRPFVTAMKIWFGKFKPFIIATELRLTSQKKRNTGRVDLFVVIDGQRYVVDVKTGAISAWHGMQTAAYKDLALSDENIFTLEELTPEAQRGKEWQRAILYLNKNGRPAWRPQTDIQDVYRYRSALALTHWRFDNGLFTYTDRLDGIDDASERRHVAALDDGASAESSSTEPLGSAGTDTRF